MNGYESHQCELLEEKEIMIKTNMKKNGCLILQTESFIILLS